MTAAAEQHKLGLQYLYGSLAATSRNAARADAVVGELRWKVKPSVYHD